MRHLKLFTFSAIIAILSVTPWLAAELSESLTLESRATMERGVKYLLDRRLENGSWVNEPAITALSIQALVQSDSRLYADEVASVVEPARQYLLAAQREDGAFIGNYQPYLNYTTAMSLMALEVIGRTEDHAAMRQARQFLMNLQLSEHHPEIPVGPDNPFYGGIGYGSGGPTVPDLSNTQLALEALYMTDYLDHDTEREEQVREVWGRAVEFLQSVQRIPEEAGEDWEPEPREIDDFDGGFIYRPDQCRVRDGKTTDEFEGEPISYGATTLGGLKSLLYAEIDKDDYRVRAAITWIKNNYTLEDNPRIGPEGHYYYLWTFARAMQIYGRETLDTPDGEIKWRRELLNKVLELQKEEGSWLNERSGRYMESIPELTTAYAMIAMQATLTDE